MEDALNRVDSKLAESRAILDQIKKGTVIGRDQDDHNLIEYSEVIDDSIRWAKWLSQQNRIKLAQLFSEDELNIIDSDLVSSLQILLEIQNDRQNKNFNGRIYTDQAGVTRDILARHSRLLFVGRARLYDRDILREARTTADDAEETLLATKKLLSLKAVGTLAEYFQNLVAPDIEKPTRTEKKWSRKWASESLKNDGYRFRKRWNNGYESRARKWLYLTLFLALASTVYAGVIIFGVDKIQPTDSASLVYARVFLKILALTVPILLVRFCIKTYNAFTHLAVINSHRSAVLLTFNSIKQDMPDTNQQKEILIELMKFVADPGETGLISRNEGAGDLPSLNFPTLKP